MLFVFIPLLTLSWFGFTAPASTTLYTPAYDLKNGKLLYTEERYQTDINRQPQQWRFVYKNTSGQPIVNRNVNFKKSKIKPDYRLEDLRDGYLEGAEQAGSQIRVFARRNSDEPLKEKMLTVPEPAVVDAGFNFFIDDNWDALMSGEVFHINFVAPIEQDYFKFRLYKDKEFESGGRKSVVFKLDIDNFFLRIFVEPIRVTYDMETRKLMIYEGISNINDDQGKSHRVRMIFSYK